MWRWEGPFWVVCVRASAECFGEFRYREICNIGRYLLIYFFKYIWTTNDPLPKQSHLPRHTRPIPRMPLIPSQIRPHLRVARILLKVLLPVFRTVFLSGGLSSRFVAGVLWGGHGRWYIVVSSAVDLKCSS